MEAVHQSRQCLIIAVDDVDATYTTLQEKGVETINAPHDLTGWGVRCFHLHDPDGNHIEIDKEIGP
ncbi:MAG: VOC family protein [Thermaerobacter sp.]|nr:VOC family protein [Thermaerobacter sp.]